MAQHTEITFEEGWLYIQKGVTKLIKIIEGEPEPPFDAEEYMNLYTTIYKMCSHSPGYSKQLYEKYREVIEDYTIQTVLPSLREKHDEDMLRELVKKWDNHKVLVRWLSRFFLDVDCYLARRGIPRLREVGLTCFHELIHKEREGEQTDKALVKNILDIYVENGMGTMEKYEEDFERFMLQDTASYY
ncbi:unnamed protein product [Arabidopsis lyrata]|uniref:Cullin N-terminal domain-containing protein n=1 Tax=Arabidopsis lyrata subsp. lyrata TaxID=81972 RepID=D7KXR7_ARALL|nr:hypothetical protein ARALYDRAFT_338401 [Arabidopsis lyrata subsp. lyrata]CAH8256440.1 unnamed protein product [Arabidopsis lyrata]